MNIDAIKARCDAALAEVERLQAKQANAIRIIKSIKVQMQGQTEIKRHWIEHELFKLIQKLESKNAPSDQPAKTV